MEGRSECQNKVDQGGGGGRIGRGRTQGLNVKIRWTRGGGGENWTWKDTRSECQNKVDQGGGGGRMGSGKTQGLNVKIRWTRGGGGEWEVEKHKV